MKPHEKDLVVSKEILEMFKNSVRIIDKKHLVGIYPIDPGILTKLRTVLPQKQFDEVLKKYDLAMAYQGKNIKADFAANGLTFLEDRIVKGPILWGIPVPWPLLRKAGIDNRKFNVVLTPRM